VKALQWQPHTHKNKFFTMNQKGAVEEHLYQEGHHKLTAFSPFNTLVVPLNHHQLALVPSFESSTNPVLLNKYYLQHQQKAQETIRSFEEDPEEILENKILDRLAAGYSLDSWFHNKQISRSFTCDYAKSIQSFWDWISACGS
jgi:hypothetical protein